MEPTIYKPSIYKGAGIYKTGAEGGGGDLPEGYTPAIYGRTNGSVSLEFTDLNVNYNDKFVIELDLKTLQSVGSLGFYAIAGSKYIYTDTGSISGSSFTPRYSYNGNTTSSANWLNYSNGGLIRITCNKRYCTIDNDLSNYHKTIDRNTTATDVIIDKLGLFSWSRNGTTHPFEGTIYSLKVYDKDNPDKLNADFVPCSNENNVLGFYEKISGQFQGSANLVE